MQLILVIATVGVLMAVLACTVLYRQQSDQVSKARSEAGLYHDHFRRLFDEAVIAYHDIDTSGVIQRVNRAECELLGYESDQIIGRAIWELVAPGEKPESQRAVYGKLSGEIPIVPFQCEYVTGDGRHLTLEVHENILFNENGAAIGIRSAHIDISRRVVAESELINSRRLFEQIANSAPGMLWITDNARRITFANDRWLKFTGESLNTELSIPWQHIINTHNSVSLHHDFNAYDFDAFRAEFEIVRSDGQSRWLIVSSVPRFSCEGRYEGYIGSATDITEQRESEQRLRLLESVVVNATEGVMITDAELDAPGPHILDVNKSFSTVTGYQKPDVLGKSPRILQGPLTDRNQLASVAAAMRQGKPLQMELLNYRKDGTPFWNEIDIAPIFDEKGKLTHCISFQRDVTERKHVENEIQRYTRELKQKNHALSVAASTAKESTELKSRFLANMSHEIRTPMNGIIGMVGLLLSTTLTSEQNDYARSIRESANALLVVVNDILDLSRIEAGKLEIDSLEFSFRSLVEEVISPLAISADAKELDLIVSISPEIPSRVGGDPTRIRQVITNLTANAIKFTERGHVSVSLQVVESTADKALIKVSVEDTGIGIPADQCSRLFQRFSQADNSPAWKYGGSGLGLSISRQLVELMGGTMGLETEIGKGSTFWFTVPLRVQHCTAPARIEAPVQQCTAVEKPEAKRILIAEDNEINRRIALRILEKSGFTAEAVSNGKLALEALKHEHYDLVLMDVQMPEMDGFEATTAIRNLATAVRQIPIIAMTANAMAGDREKCIAFGMDDYISKPVSLPILQSALERWMPKGTTTPESLARP